MVIEADNAVNEELKQAHEKPQKHEEVINTLNEDTSHFPALNAQTT